MPARPYRDVVTLTRFGAMLRRLREANGISQNRLAQQAGFDVAVINKAERNGLVPSRKLVLAMTEALDVSPDDRDRLLFAAGYAPVRDFQGLFDAALARLGAMQSAYLAEVAS